MADFWLRFNDFKGGDWGDLDPSRADQDQFSATNLDVYPSGLIGPRAGIKELPTTGLPDIPTIPGPVGFAAWNSTLLIVLNRVYQVPMAGGAATAWAVYGTPAVTATRFVAFNKLMFSLHDGVLYKHNGATSTTPITTPAPLSIITRWKYWLVGVDRNVPWKIWYSNLNDPDTWGVNNYLDIGNNDPITVLLASYNTLNVGKREGWWAVSGVLGTLSTVRDVVIGNGPVGQRSASVTTDNRIVYWPVERVPAWFNGDRVSLDNNQRMNGRSLPFMCDAVVVAPTGRRIVLAGDVAGVTEIRSWRDQVWTHHSFGQLLGGLVPTDVRAGSDMPEHVAFGVLRAATIGERPVIFSTHHDLGRPAHVNDQYASPTDLSGGFVTGSLTLPSWWDSQGRQVVVRSVIVQFRKWASGVSGAFNRMRCQITALGPYGRGREVGEQHNWAEPCEQASTSGEDDSWRINLGNQGPGNGILIEFPIMAGVAIREVAVGVTVRTERT